VSLYGLMPLSLIPVGAAAAGDATPATRRCGRCLAQFPGDPDADPVVIPEFWLCPACRVALLGKLEDAGVSVGAARAGVLAGSGAVR
jgi:hypothetical protein